MFVTTEIKKRPEGLVFDEVLDIKADLMSRNPEILDVGPVSAKGKISYETGLYLLTYDLTCELTLPSSRSMEPVVVVDHYVVTEAFAEEGAPIESELLEGELVLTFLGDKIDLRDSVIDNILLNIPLRVLTAEEEAGQELPSGSSWTVLTQEQYAEQEAQKKKENSPFAGLSDFFEENSEK